MEEKRGMGNKMKTYGQQYKEEMEKDKQQDIGRINEENSLYERTQ